MDLWAEVGRSGRRRRHALRKRRRCAEEAMKSFMAYRSYSFWASGWGVEFSGFYRKLASRGHKLFVKMERAVQHQ